MNSFYACLALTLFASPLRGLEIRKINRELAELPNIFVDQGACPFECCTYRAWKAEKDAILYDRPHGNKVVGRIKKGDDAEGLTGQVETKPIPVTVTTDHTDDNGNRFRKGDKFFLLTYMGEGYFKAWSGWNIFDLDSTGIKVGSEDRGKGPFWARASRGYEKVWWKKVKTRDGAVGWTKEDVFSGQDSCG